MIRKTLLFAAALLLVAQVACKKDDDKSPSEILTAGTWTQSDYKEDSDGDGDIESTIEPCDKDDTFTFKTDGTLEYRVGALKCAPTDTDGDGTWALSADNKTLTIVQGIGLPLTIKEISNNRLVLSIPDFFDPTAPASESTLVR
jgi:hypothetical protein